MGLAETFTDDRPGSSRMLQIPRVARTPPVGTVLVRDRQPQTKHTSAGPRVTRAVAAGLFSVGGLFFFFACLSYSPEKFFQNSEQKKSSEFWENFSGG